MLDLRPRMLPRLRPSLALVALLPTAACFRTVERDRPARDVPCPPPTGQSVVRITRDTTGARSVRGRVADMSAAPLAYAAVRLSPAQREVLTDSLGRFRLDSLPMGRHAFRFLRIGYFPREDTITVRADAGVELEVRLVQAAFDRCPELVLVRERVRIWRWPWQ